MDEGRQALFLRAGSSGNADSQRPNERIVADLGQRFAAKAIDLCLILIPFSILAIIIQQQLVMNIMVWIFNVYFIGMVGAQVFLLSSSGQTLGKKVLHIQVVRKSDGRNGGFWTNVILRAVVSGLLEFTVVYLIADILFIFRPARRCLHDYVAGTVVVQSPVRR